MNYVNKNDLLTKSTTFKIMVIDNYYKYPEKVRNYALELEYNSNGNYSEFRSDKTSANNNIKNNFEKYMEPICGKIIDFEIKNTANGCFEYLLSTTKSIIKTNNKQWTGIIFLTPHATVDSGIQFYNSNECVDFIGNTFNRLVLFDSTYISSMIGNFGNDINSGSIYQTFYLSTEK